MTSTCAFGGKGIHTCVIELTMGFLNNKR